MTFRVLFFAAFAFVPISISFAESDPAQSSEIWGQANQLEAIGEYAEAADVYDELAAMYPNSQRTILRKGICLEQAGFEDQAVTAFGKAIDIAPYGQWAEKALYHRARTCSSVGCTEIAWDSISLLRNRFPDSAWLTKAEVVEARMIGEDPQKAEDFLTLEMAASVALTEAMQADAAQKIPTREIEGDGRAMAAEPSKGDPVDMLQSIVDAYPETSTAIRAKDMKANILIRRKQYDAATAELESLLDDIGSWAPNSRVAEETATRLAALYGKQQRNEEALAIYQDLSANAEKPSVYMNAMERMGHMMIRLDRREEAMKAFEDLITEVQATDDTGEKRAVLDHAKTRLAALNHSAGKKDRALGLYKELESSSTDREIVSNARLQVAGISFEFLQQKRWQDIHDGRRFDRSALVGDGWDEMRRKCVEVMESGFAKPEERVRAEIMRVESYHWQQDATQALDAANTFLGKYEETEHANQIAMAHMVAGESLQKMGGPENHLAAIEHFRAVIKEVPNWRYASRAEYRIYHSLRRCGIATPEEVEEAANRVLTLYPESRHAGLIRTARRFNEAKIYH